MALKIVAKPLLDQTGSSHCELCQCPVQHDKPESYVGFVIDCLLNDCGFYACQGCYVGIQTVTRQTDWRLH